MGSFPHFERGKPYLFSETADRMSVEVEQSDEEQRETSHLAELVGEETKVRKGPAHPG